MNMLIDNRVHEGLNIFMTEHGVSYVYAVNDFLSIPISLEFIEKAVDEKLRGDGIIQQALAHQAKSQEEFIKTMGWYKEDKTE